MNTLADFVANVANQCLENTVNESVVFGFALSNGQSNDMRSLSLRRRPVPFSCSVTLQAIFQNQEVGDTGYVFKWVDSQVPWIVYVMEYLTIRIAYVVHVDTT